MSCHYGCWCDDAEYSVRLKKLILPLGRKDGKWCQYLLKKQEQMRQFRKVLMKLYSRKRKKKNILNYSWFLCNTEEIRSWEHLCELSTELKTFVISSSMGSRRTCEFSVVWEYSGGACALVTCCGTCLCCRSHIDWDLSVPFRDCCCTLNRTSGLISSKRNSLHMQKNCPTVWANME